MKHISTITSFFLFPAFVLLAHAVASLGLHLYAIFPNLDIPFHFMGGFSIAYTISKTVAYMEQKKLIGVISRAMLLITIFSLTATATVFWEFAEFISDRLFTMNVQVSLANTMQDQFMGILGGTIWILFLFRDQKKDATPTIR